MPGEAKQAEQFIRSGHLGDALESLRSSVRAAPADAALRVFLFQLHAVLGEWEKAYTQLDVAAELDAKNLLMAQASRAAIECELFRNDVFSKGRAPLVLGEPEEWVGLMIQANQRDASGDHAAAAEYRARALEDAPAIAGTLVTGDSSVDARPAQGAGPQGVGHESFEWLADADSRLGPMFEAIIDGKYYWVPMSRVASVEIEPPSDLRDLVWLPAMFSWTNGGKAVSLLPVRYPGSESASDDRLKLARLTEWRELSEDSYAGLGQREFATDASEYPMLAVRRIDFDVEVDPGAAGEAAEPADA